MQDLRAPSAPPSPEVGASTGIEHRGHLERALCGIERHAAMAISSGHHVPPRVGAAARPLPLPSYGEFVILFFSVAKHSLAVPDESNLVNFRSFPLN